MQHQGFSNSYYQHPLSKQVSPPVTVDSETPIADPATLDSNLLLPLSSSNYNNNSNNSLSYNSFTIIPSSSSNQTTPRNSSDGIKPLTAQQAKLMKFEQALAENAVDIGETLIEQHMLKKLRTLISFALSEKLRKLSWTGIPSKYRPIVWKLLLDYVPPYSSRHEVLFI